MKKDKVSILFIILLGVLLITAVVIGLLKYKKGGTVTLNGSEPGYQVYLEGDRGETVTEDK